MKGIPSLSTIIGGVVVYFFARFVYEKFLAATVEKMFE